MRKKIIISTCCVLIMFIILHSTPSVALRTHLFMTGHPIVSFTTGILDDEIHNNVDKSILEKQNARCYTLTKPAFEQATKSNLRNYKVIKKGFIFLADYYGEA